MIRGLLDTSVVIDFVELPDALLPAESSISVATLAELHTGVLLARSSDERLARERFTYQVERLYRAIPIDAETARAYSHLAHRVRTAGRNPRRRVMDLWIAATAITQSLPLYTRNAKDFIGLSSLLTVHVV